MASDTIAVAFFAWVTANAITAKAITADLDRKREDSFIGISVG
jgi:hypothetical protein